MLKKIGVISDAHGNLQALTVALDYLKSQGCQEIIHTGDVVDIGAQSAECLKLLLDNGVVCLLGNHDKDFAENNYRHKPFSHVSTKHKQYVFSSAKDYRDEAAKFPLFVERTCGGKKLVFEHYCRYDEPQPNGYLFRTILSCPTAEDFDEYYRSYNCDAVFFGHKHEPCDLVGNKLYVDVGSVGCHQQPLACGLIISYDDDNFSYRRFALPYDRELTEKLMKRGDLPSGEYLFDFYYLHSHAAFRDE